MKQLIKHVAGIAEIVDDLNSAIQFYRDTLGLEVTQLPGGGYAIVKVSEIRHFGLWSREAAAKATFGDPILKTRIPLGFTLGFEVDDVEEASHTFQSHGGTLIQQPQREPWGQQTSRFLSPSGALCEFSKTGESSK